jgi:glyoxylase-like metal-dependent hydrolase (beta-lactamase superfamily II)
MITELAPNLYVIKVRLVGSPLKILNSYVFTGKDRNLLIDTGFNQPECMEDLSAGIRELNLDMEKTDVFLTHLHADHSGLVGKIISPRSKVFIGALDKEFIEMRWYRDEEYKNHIVSRFLGDGFPKDEFWQAYTVNPSASLAGVKRFEMTPMRGGETLTLGDRKLVAIDTPGHTPGHLCLYEADEKIMVLGDMVLFDITPNITSWQTLPNALKHYLESLQKIRRYDVALPLPGHRECHCAMLERIDELLAHHKKRLEEAVGIIASDPGVNAYTVASRLTWSIRAKNWQDFPLAQKWFAFGETLSHLDYLVAEGVISRTVTGGIARYTIQTLRQF